MRVVRRQIPKAGPFEPDRNLAPEVRKVRGLPDGMTLPRGVGAPDVPVAQDR
jgi:hypothetical protein